MADVRTFKRFGGIGGFCENISENATVGPYPNTLIDASSGNVTITLPDAATFPGLEKTFKRVDNSSNTISIDGHSTQTIDGQETISSPDFLGMQYASLTIFNDGLNWFIK